jgi:hypothetical protein
LNATRRLEEASQEAFATEIWKCENLLRFFKGETVTQSTEPKAAVPATPAARTVETVGLTKITSKKDREAEEFLSGAGKKKQAKKPGQPKATQKPSKGFVLSMDVMASLGDLGVSLPVNEEAVKTTVEQLREKLQYFKDNQERVTQEVGPMSYHN